MGVPTPTSKVPSSANALNAWHSKQSTPTSENYELYLRKPTIETYVAVASELRISVTNGYLFRPTNPHGHIVNKPLASSTADERLKLYLKEAQIYEGETLHSFRSGSAITLALSQLQVGGHNVSCWVE